MHPTSSSPSATVTTPPLTMHSVSPCSSHRHYRRRLDQLGRHSQHLTPQVQPRERASYTRELRPFPLRSAFQANVDWGDSQLWDPERELVVSGGPSGYVLNRSYRVVPAVAHLWCFPSPHFALLRSPRLASPRLALVIARWPPVTSPPYQTPSSHRLVNHSRGQVRPHSIKRRRSCQCSSPALSLLNPLFALWSSLPQLVFPASSSPTLSHLIIDRSATTSHHLATANGHSSFIGMFLSLLAQVDEIGKRSVTPHQVGELVSVSLQFLSAAVGHV